MQQRRVTRQKPPKPPPSIAVMEDAIEGAGEVPNKAVSVRIRDATPTLDDLREAVATLAEIERTARRVFGGAHPDTVYIEQSLRNARAKLRARETPSPRGA